MMRSISPALAAIMLSGVVPWHAYAKNMPAPDSFDFAHARIESWTLTATTYLARDANAGTRWSPTVRSVGCFGNGPQGFFHVEDGRSELEVGFLGPPDPDGNRNGMTLHGDHLWLYIDGERWEFAYIPARRTDSFPNGRYPKPKPAHAGDIVVVPWRGLRAVRRSEQDPWLDIEILYGRFLEAKRIEWGYKSRDWTQVDQSVVGNRLPEGWQDRRYPIDNKGLRDGIMWCARQVASDAAYVLPERLR